MWRMREKSKAAGATGGRTGKRVPGEKMTTGKNNPRRSVTKGKEI